jgi:lysophospholipase L1-like esterase
VLAAQQGADAQKRARRIAVFGSSVANGTGDELRKEGYTGRLRDLLAPKGWEVFNQSRGGDNTLKMAPRFEPAGEPDPRTRYLVTVDPSYVLLGLSLGNEGLQTAKTPEDKQAVFAQFEKGMRGFVDRSREHHIVPIVTLCYTRNDSTALDYALTRRMNLLINTWDVPSVNFLGAVDDGTGKWADGFWNDALHPTAAGHSELLTTFVPTLFEALEQNKPLPSQPADAGYARIGGSGARFTFAPESTMHPFALAMTVRAAADGTIAGITGSTLNATTVPAPPPARGGTTDRRVTTLSPGVPFTAAVGISGGVWTYTSASGARIASTVKADSGWHQVVVSHYTARGETLFFVDGSPAGSVSERLQPAAFSIGGPAAGQQAAPRQADYKDVYIYRSALNADEVSALHSGTLLQASLEIYAPLADGRPEKGTALENRAQSLSALVVAGGSAAHVR